MTRETSIRAYKEIVASGLVSKRRRQILFIVANYGPITANEAFDILKEKLGDTFKFDSNSHARFTELREQDLIYERCTRPCKVTGRTVIEWEMTLRKPTPYVKKETATEKLKRENRLLKEEIATLKKKYCFNEEPELEFLL